MHSLIGRTKRRMPLRDPIRLPRDPPAVRLRMRKHRRDRVRLLRRFGIIGSSRGLRDRLLLCPARRSGLDKKTPGTYGAQIPPPVQKASSHYLFPACISLASTAAPLRIVPTINAESLQFDER